MSSSKSGQILKNRQKKKKKKMEVLLPEAGMIEKKKKGSMIQSTPAESYLKVSYMRPDQTRPVEVSGH
jgi:hypothetical protein